ncbi:unnamed protein product [Closterium sp. NIES-54]
MAKALYDTVVKRYSSPSSATISRLALQFLFPELADFTTVADLITHLRSLDTCYLAALDADFLAENKPPMYLTIYFLTIRLPDTLRAVRDHFLSLDPTKVTIDSFEKRLLEAESAALAVAASRGTPLPSVFEGCSPSLLVSSVASAAAVDFLGAEEVGDASAPAGRGKSGKGKGGKGGGGGGGGGGSGREEEAVAAVEVVGVVGAVGVVEGAGVEIEVDLEGVELEAQLCALLCLVVQPVVEATLGVDSCSFPGTACTRTDHTEPHCFFLLNDLYRAEHGEQLKTPDWLALLKKDIDVFACDSDVIHAGMYAMYAASASVEGDCYSCVPRAASIETASFGAFALASTGAEPEEALHSFTLDSGASRCFFRDCTTITPLTVPVPVTLADPSGGPVVTRGATVLPCPAAPSGLLTSLHLPLFAKNLVATSVLQDQWVTVTQPGGELVAICTDSRTGEHLATFTRRLRSGLYTLTTESMPPLPRSLTPPCLPRVEGRQRAAPHSSSLPPTTPPLQTLHMDVSVLGFSRTSRSCVCTLTEVVSSAPASFEDFCGAVSIRQMFTLPASPQQNGIAERRIGLVMEVALTSIVHAAAPHFLWSFAGRPIQFDTWLDDLQLYLLSDSRDSVSLFDHTSGAAPAPPATADSATRSKWLTRDAAARLAIRNHLPLAESAHFGQHRTALALYDAVVACYSSPATAALGRLLLPYLFPELSAFATVEDLVSHLSTSDACYCAAAPAEFLDRNQPPMFITLYFVVTRLLDSLRSVRDHFLSLDPTVLTIDLLEQHLLATETSVVAVGASRGTPRTPFFERCSPSPLAPSYASAAAVDVPGAENVGAAFSSAKRRNSKGKGGRGGGVGSEGGGGGSSAGGGGSGGGGSGGSGGGSGGFGSGGGQRQQHQPRNKTPSPQQLREWLSQRGASGGSASCPYVIRTGDRAGQTCGKPHTQHRCFSRLDNPWHAEFGDEVERPCWAELLRFGVAIFDLDYDAILFAMYALSVSAEGDYYLCVPPDPGIEAAALGASESSLPRTVPVEALHTFTLDLGASHCFFRDCTNLTPLPAPVPVRLADPSGGLVVARSSTVLPCPAVPSGSLLGLHLPSFSTNLVSIAALQDLMVTTTTPRGQRVSICTCTRTSRHLATFTRRPGLSLYTLATEPPQVAASAQVSASGQVAPPCSYRLLSHQTLLWHHRLGHPSLPRLRGMHSHLLVSGLPRSLPPLPPLPAPLCLPCVEGRQRAAPHSSSFPPTIAPLQTLHMDMWGPARVSGQGRERYFLLVIDDYTRYTTVFPLCSKGQVVDVLIPWIRAVRLQLRERFRTDLPVLRLHFDRGGEFSSDLLRDFCHGEGILHSFTLPDSPQQNGIVERRIGLVMELCVSLPETSPTLRWTGEVGDASVFRVWGSRAFVHDTSADKLSARAIPCVFLGFPPDAPGWLFYHPTLRHVFPSQDVTFDKSVPFYHLFPYRSTPPPPPPLFLVPGPPPVDPLSPQGPTPSGVSQVDPLPSTMPVLVAGDSSAARGAVFGGVETGGAEPGGAESEGVGSGGAEPGGAETAGVELGGAEPEGVEPGVAEPWGSASAGGPVGASHRMSPRPEPVSPKQLHELFSQRTCLRSGAAGAGDPAAGDTGAGGARDPAGAGGIGGAAAAGSGGARTRARAGGNGAGGTGAGGVGVGGAGAVHPKAGGGAPASPLPAPSPYSEKIGGLSERHEPASRPASLVRTGHRVPRPRPPPVPSTHAMTLCPSSVPLRLTLPPPPESSLPGVPDLESDLARAASPTVSRLLATVVTDPSFESTAASALVAELVDFAAACPLDYATSLVVESASASPPSVRGECALGTDVLEDRQEDFECLAAVVPRFASMLLAPEGDPDAPDIPTLRSYAEVITVDGMWIFRVKRPPGSPPAFKARYVARGFRQRQGVDYFQTFSPTPKMTTLWVLLHVTAQRDYELHSLDFSTPFLQGSLHEEIWLRRPLGFTGLREVPREWHDTLRTTLSALGFTPSTADPSLFLCTDTSLLPFYVLVYVDDLVFATADTEALTLVLQRFAFQFSSPQPTPLSTGHSLSAPPSNESVEPSGPFPELVGCLMYVMTCTRPDLAYPLSLLARYVAPGRHRKVHWDAAKRVLWYLCSMLGMGLMLGGRCPVVLTGHADASWELRWLTFLLTGLGEQPRSPPVLYVDIKAMIALCQEHRLEHRTKHIAMRYFLARELQQRGQLRLAYVATWANTDEIFTKALPPGSCSLGVSQVDPSPLVEPVEVSSDTSGPAEGGDPTHAATPVVVDAGAAGGGATGGADSGGAGSGGAECPMGTRGTGGAGAAGAGVAAVGGAGVGSVGGAGRQVALSPERLREWAIQWGNPGGGASCLRAGGAVTAGAGGSGTVGAGGSATGGTGVASAGRTGARRQETLSPERLREWAVQWGSPGGGASRARAGGDGTTGVGATRAGRTSAAGTGVGSAGATGAGGTGGASPGGTGAHWQENLSSERLREWAVRWGSPGGGASRAGTVGAGGSRTGAGGPLGPVTGGSGDQSQPQLLPDSPLPAPAPYTERRAHASRPVTPVRSRHAVRPRPPPASGTHIMALRPSSVPYRVVLPSPPASSLPHVLDPESNLVRTANPTVTRLLATTGTDPSFESAAASTLVAELVDFAALCCLEYAAILVFCSFCPPSVRGELALGCDVLKDS